MSEKKKASLTTRILIAMILGAIVGGIIGAMGNPDWATIWLTEGIFRVVGQVFISLLQMLVVPLVFVSLVCGSSALSDPKVLGRVGGKTIALYLLTTGIAVTLALGAALLFKPGVGVEAAAATPASIAAGSPFTQVLIDMVPKNPVAAMAQGQMLPIILFSVLLGIAITLSGARGQRIGAWFNDMNEVIMKLVGLVMRFAPYGVFALIAILAATSDFAELKKLGKYVLLVFAVLFVHALVVYPTLLVLVGRLNPWMFLYKMRAAMLFAFSTASSNATLPITLETVRKRLGVSNKVASFTVPLGATINMDGTAIMQGIATGFIAQFYGIELGAGQFLMVVVMVILASIGTAGVPSVGLIVLAGVLSQVGLPAEGIAMILGIDRVLDMTRTAVNITGDATVTTLVAKSEGELDLDVFNDPEAGADFESATDEAEAPPERH
ncbi:dicarboxylate/amino acid:cation symporter [Marinihelvus fidelis]|uniref:Dicarboxylate/amino acid:cation symporter n=1 Tax=Marinihelvus fidelis TaxID=2613842 RepID=A0A5N0T3D7_9GAMM|nr:dicarboxylate/amino acid:cation symporter [Marinihelvus fidelis]KAA9129585.1 dicarboxylate/amino acid:cation symporter [Marinihelvus fidelis]